MSQIHVLVRRDKDVSRCFEIGRVVYEALQGMGLPNDDHIQLITGFKDDESIYNAGDVDLRNLESPVIVQINGPDQQRFEHDTICNAIVDRLMRDLLMAREEIFIRLLNSEQKTGHLPPQIARSPAQSQPSIQDTR